MSASVTVRPGERYSSPTWISSKYCRSSPVMAPPPGPRVIGWHYITPPPEAPRGRPPRRRPPGLAVRVRGGAGAVDPAGAAPRPDQGLHRRGDRLLLAAAGRDRGRA